MGKKVGEAQKLSQSCQKWEKLKKLVLYAFAAKKYIKNYKMRIISNKKYKISHYQLKKIGEKKIGTPQNKAKISKIEKNLYYVHFDTKIYIKNYNIKVI